MKAVKNAIRNVFRLGDKYITFALISLVGAFCVVAALMLIDNTDSLSNYNKMPYDSWYRAIPTNEETDFIGADYRCEFTDVTYFFMAHEAVSDYRVSHTYLNKEFDMRCLMPNGSASQMESNVFTVNEVPESKFDGSFRRGERLLVKGRHITAEDSGQYFMLIDEKLAEINNLTIGSEVNFILEDGAYYLSDSLSYKKNIEADDITYRVVGIFKTTIAQTAVDNAADVVNNLIYVSDIGSSNGWLVTSSYDYYVKLRPDVDAKAFFEYLYSFESYIPTPTNTKTPLYHFVAVDELNAEYNSSANTLLSISTVMLGVLVVTVTCASLAFCRVLVSSRRREILIMRALGARNSRIVGQLLIELVIVLIPFAVIGASTAALTLNPVVARVLEYFATVVSPENVRNTSSAYLDTINAITNVVTQPPSRETLIWLCVITCAVFAVITVISSCIQISRVTKEKQMALLSEGRR